MPHRATLTDSRRRFASATLIGIMTMACSGWPTGAETAVAPLLAQETSSLAVTTTPAAQAVDWRADIGTFKVGLARGWSSDMSPAMLQRLERKLAGSLGLPVRVVTFDRFASLIDAQAAGAIDYAVYSARSYAAAQLACECLTVLAQPTGEAGETGQIAHLIGDAARLSGLRLADGARLGWTGAPGSAAAAMVHGRLMVGGVPVSGDDPFWVRYGSQEQAAAAYEQGEIDGFIVHLPARTPNDRPADSQLGRSWGLARSVSVQWSSEFWPYGPHAVRAALAPEAQHLLANVLARLDVEDPALHALLADGFGGPLRPVSSDAYRAVTRSVQRGVDAMAQAGE
jgi:phosphonate transport system substrate-binding protein